MASRAGSISDRYVEPMITPDTKNWTWVLERACPECGFDASTWRAEAVSALLRENAQQWSLLADAGKIERGRAVPGKWSSLEYACHVRDVFRRFDERIQLMERDEDPLFANWDQDAAAEEERYDEQDPREAVEELRRSAMALADRLDGISGAAWERRGRRSDGASFTIGSLVRYMIHDPIHHLWDVGGGPWVV